jgi:hypothetical protein
VPSFLLKVAESPPLGMTGREFDQETLDRRRKVLIV